jgi:hypothetical protein
VTGRPASAEALAQSDYDVHVDCKDATCVARATAVADAYVLLTPACGVGITSEHKDQLMAAMHPSLCQPPVSWYREWAFYLVLLGAAYVAIPHAGAHAHAHAHRAACTCMRAHTHNH